MQFKPFVVDPAALIEKGFAVFVAVFLLTRFLNVIIDITKQMAVLFEILGGLKTMMTEILTTLKDIRDEE